MKNFLIALLFFCSVTFSNAGDKIIAKDFATGKSIGIEVGRDYAQQEQNPSPLQIGELIGWRWKTMGRGNERSWKEGFIKGWYLGFYERKAETRAAK